MTEPPVARLSPNANVDGPDPSAGANVLSWLDSTDPSPEDPDAFLRDLVRMIRHLLEQLAEKEPLHFPTLYAFLSYLGHKHQFSGSVVKQLHLFRKGQENYDAMDDPTPEDVNRQIQVAYQTLAVLLEEVYQLALPATTKAKLGPPPPLEPVRTPGPRFVTSTALQGIRLSGSDPVILGWEDGDPDKVIAARFDIPERNEDFTPALRSFMDLTGPSARIQLVDSELDENDVFHPRAFVLDPDHLMDVTAIAECFTPNGAFPVLHLLKRFMPSVATPAILAGLIANYFLDRLMHQPDLTFEEAFQGVFGLQPLGLARLTDEEVRDLVTQCRQHFGTLSAMVQTGFARQGIDPAKAYLEPSFYNPEYGLQGRLDVLYLPESSMDPPAIVELKSGMPFRSNTYGLNANHYIQTLLYELLVRNLRPGRPALAFILYSRSADQPLRYAPTVRALQIEALRVRNELLLLEKRLAAMKDDLPETWEVLNEVQPEDYPGLFGFSRQDMTAFRDTWKRLSAPEKAYFVAFSAFSIREYHLAKTGSDFGRTDGQSAFWTASRSEKEDQHAILSFLNLTADRSHEDDPEIELTFTGRTPKLANFRHGDLAVLYPHTGKTAATGEQIWKGTIVSLSKNNVVLRLRAPQFNKFHFTKYPFWHLERDFLDSSFTQLTRGLYGFARLPEEKRSLLLGWIPPRQGIPAHPALPDELTGEQKMVIRDILASRDYFLLWGPPGTGKTSMVLKHLVGHLYQHTTENILLLAYTNRAVDEICAAISSLGPDLRRAFMRIGSRFSTDPVFRDRLLDGALQNCRNRESVIGLIGSCRIFVATVSSLMGKPELLAIKAFDRVIVDEASQILEPVLAGLLGQFPHFTLIGDHWQLPAVVVQPVRERAISHPALVEAGFRDAGQSMFERLFNHAQALSWGHAFGMLSAQGRMHAEIMAFPNARFYDGKLTCIDAGQKSVLTDPTMSHPLDAGLRNTRVAFLPVRPDHGEILARTNAAEARAIVQIVRYYRDLYRLTGREWHPGTLGIITPFRAQIARIRRTMEDHHINPDAFTIDTVERYQGGARDIILISWCIQRAVDLPMIKSGDGPVDRKLNVALTRARERLIAVGSPDAFKDDPLFGIWTRTYRKDIKEFPSIYGSED